MKIFKILFIIFVIFLISGAVIYLNKTQTDLKVNLNIQDKDINFKATFAIFTNSTFRIFTDPKYHNLSDKVYIQVDNPNVVHVKSKNVTWKDFFNTLPMSLTNKCLTTGTKQVFCDGEGGKLSFYLNGAQAKDLLDTEIKNSDKALIIYGIYQSSQVQEFQKQLLNIE